MRKIRNPFRGNDGYHCFGCSADNERGLEMEFYLDGEEVVSTWQPRSHFEGYTGILHGGIQTTLMDEVASWCIFVQHGTAGATSKLQVSFDEPVHTDRGPLILRARIRFVEGNMVTVHVRLHDGRDRLCTEADVTCFTYPERLARRRLAYPGRESFLPAEEA